MKFASGRIEQEFSSPAFNQRTRSLLEEADTFCSQFLGWDFTITCLLRTPQENDALYGGKGDHLIGVHVDGRGADIRTRDAGTERVALVSGLLNFRWIYDPQRPGFKVAVIEDGIHAGSGPHLHLQTCSNTTLRAHD